VRAAVWQCTNGAQGTDAPYLQVHGPSASRRPSPRITRQCLDCARLQRRFPKADCDSMAAKASFVAQTALSISISRNRRGPRRFCGARLCEPQHVWERPTRWIYQNAGRPATLLRVTDPRSFGCGFAALRCFADCQSARYAMERKAGSPRRTSLSQVGSIFLNPRYAGRTDSRIIARAVAAEVTRRNFLAPKSASSRRRLQPLTCSAAAVGDRPRSGPRTLRVRST